MKKKPKAKRRAKVPGMWWFGPEMIDPLRVQLNMLPVGSGRFEARIDPKKNMTTQVVPDDTLAADAAVVFVPLNKSHYCPPDCP